MNGKGDAPRPMQVDKKTYESNWEATFGKKPKKEVKDELFRSSKCYLSKSIS